MRSLLVVSLIAMAMSVTACSDPKAASEKNFKVAMQRHLDGAYPKCYFVDNFPKTADYYGGADERYAQLQALTKAGMLSAKEIERKELKDLFSSTQKTFVKTNFDLTDEGRKAYKADATKNYRGGSVGGFCFGKATVKAVTQFSEPGDLFGQRVSRVNYEYTVSDLPKWAITPDMLAASKQLKIDAESAVTPIKALQAAILTNNGWVHESRFQK
jgi:hypothetical protein